MRSEVAWPAAYDVREDGQNVGQMTKGGSGIREGQCRRCTIPHTPIEIKCVELQTNGRDILKIMICRCCDCFNGSSVVSLYGGSKVCRTIRTSYR